MKTSPKEMSKIKAALTRARHIIVYGDKAKELVMLTDEEADEVLQLLESSLKTIDELLSRP